ncbi:hypothetical protein OL548_32000 [Lysinibacillus sp. MHQ-1]|nr:hypothetical protein OL548_32000 [Lysinibacillus sp. MHQ-1]
MFKQIEIITAYFRKVKPRQTLWVTASFWQWRKRKRLGQLGYKPIIRMKHYKVARFERQHVQKKYGEWGAMFILSIKSKRWNIAMQHFLFF